MKINYRYRDRPHARRLYFFDCLILLQKQFYNGPKFLAMCVKLLYPKQCRNLTVTGNITRQHAERIICCDRCTKKITKNQCPSNAFWNNMTVSPIPEELACLSEIELRLISRIKPFVRVAFRWTLRSARI